MSITDKLREWAKALTHWWYDPVKHEYTYTTGGMPTSIDAIRLDSTIIAIADRIDAEHEAKVSYWQGASYKDGYDEGFASADDWLAQHEDAMAEHGWVRLPVDGEAPCKQLGEWIEKRGLITGPLDHDGELWHKGDMSASPWGVIEGIVFENGKWFIRGHDTSAPWLPADSLLHYHAPTVEDVLTEMVAKVIERGELTNGAAQTIAEYAGKLRLAKEDA